jgi:hypothetical protein
MNPSQAGGDKRMTPAADRHNLQPIPGVSAETAGGVARVGGGRCARLYFMATGTRPPFPSLAQGQALKSRRLSKSAGLHVNA